jgi:hypothetical protein
MIFTTAEESQVVTIFREVSNFTLSAFEEVDTSPFGFPLASDAIGTSIGDCLKPEVHFPSVQSVPCFE